MKKQIQGMMLALSVFLPALGHAKHHSTSGSSSSSSHPQGYWQPLANQPTFLQGAANQMLLTDGRVLVRNIQATKPTSFESETNAYEDVWVLTPDEFGSYVNGTWSQVASLPSGYAPAFYASAVLPDGRVLIQGGEVNGLNEYVWQGDGAIYDPVGNFWVRVEPPAFFNNYFSPPPPSGVPTVGDAASVVLPDGTFMLQNCCGPHSALFDAETLTYRQTGLAPNGLQTKFGCNNEEGWVLLPNGKVLTVDCYNFNFIQGDYTPPPVLTGSEIYDPETGRWSPDSGNTIVKLNGFPDTDEAGPMILRPDGKVIVFGAGETGQNALYDYKKNKWSIAEGFPFVPGEGQLNCQDAGAALLPNGNVLVSAGPGFTNPPQHFFEFTYDTNELIEQPGIPNSSVNSSADSNMLVLPTGQIMLTDGTTDVQIYTSGDQCFNSDWAPVVNDAPKEVRRGKTYKIKGIRFNGMSQAQGYGDEDQAATNYPLVRITNHDTGHVFYCRTHDHSYMGVASDRKVHTYFDVPENIETGKSKLEVVANGIPSKARTIHVKG